MFGFSPLRRKLILIAVASLLPLAILSAIGLAFLFAQQRDAEQRRTLDVARALASAVDSELKRTIAGLEVMAAAVEQDNLDLVSFDDLSVRTLRRQPMWRSIVLADASGQQIAHSEFKRAGTIPANPDPASVHQVFATGRPVVGNLVEARIGWGFAVRVPVMKAGKVHYAVSAVLTPKPILDIVQRQGVSEDWVISVFDAKGTRVARSRGHERFLGTQGHESLVKLMAGPAREGMGITRTVEGDELFTAYARLPDNGWTVVMGMPQTLVYGPALRSTAVYAVALILSAIAGLLVAFALARRLEEREELLARAQSARSEAEAANHAKDQFLAMLGHELRNPIAAISNAAQLIEMGDRHPEAAARARGIVKRQVAILARLTDDLLDAARAILGKIELRKEPVDLAAAASNALASLTASGRGTGHRIQSDLREAWVAGDAMRLEQVISNLLVNAVKYTPEGGRITVRTGRRAGEAFVEVEDDGIGLSPELAAKAFDLFVQGRRDADRSQGGLGIGLTLVRRLADLHGGSASVTSSGENMGSLFRVRIPPIDRPPQAAIAQGPSAGRTLTVLLIEDNDDARETLQALLELKGHRVETAGDGITGLEKGLALAPDLAIIDLGLPGMDGYDVARRMRASSVMGNTYLVALTGYGTAEARQRALASGFDEHLTKPVALETLEHLLGMMGECPPQPSTPSIAT